MLKKLLFTAALISSTFGGDSTLMAGEPNLEPHHTQPITVVYGEHLPENVTAKLDRIQSS